MRNDAHLKLERPRPGELIREDILPELGMTYGFAGACKAEGDNAFADRRAGLEPDFACNFMSNLRTVHAPGRLQRSARRLWET